MEALLQKTMKDTQRAREGVLELEKLKTENLQLQNKFKDDYGNQEDPEQMQLLREELADQN